MELKKGNIHKMKYKTGEVALVKIVKVCDSGVNYSELNFSGKYEDLEKNCDTSEDDFIKMVEDYEKCVKK